MTRINPHNDNDPLPLPNVDSQIRLNRLRQQIREVTGEEVIFGPDDNVPPELLEKFLEQVLAFEQSAFPTQLEILTRQGIDLPPPDQLDDVTLHDKLWEIIRALAKQRAFIYHTNHLSDRELYTQLLTESLREEAVDLPADSDAVYIIDLLGACRDEDIYLDMKYYAGDAERARWLKDFPDYEMPPHEAAPYDRDRLLPVAPDPSDSSGARDPSARR